MTPIIWTREMEATVSAMRADGKNWRVVARALGVSFEACRKRWSDGHNVWTDERVERLRELVPEGKSGTEIAKMLGNGITRQAVNSKANRLGLRLVGEHGDKFKAYRVAEKAARAAPRPPRVVAPPQDGPGPLSVTLLEIRPFQCRWVVQDAPQYEMDAALMCGEPTIEGSYCAHHYAKSRGGAPARRAMDSSGFLLPVVKVLDRDFDKRAA